jgi:phosphatidyl-myo-inositol alpha-mannosyltransferase
MRSPLRIALAHPFCWPHVRRGSERFLHDLTKYLTTAGHDVTVFSTAPVAARQEFHQDARLVLFPQRIANGGRRLNATHVFPFQCAGEIAAGGFDVVHCLSYFDAFAASLGSRRGVRYVFQSLGIPIRRYFRTIPHDYLMFRRGLKNAAVAAVISTFAAERLRIEFGYRARLLRVPVDTEHFKPGDGSSEPPLILMAGALDEPRKGAALLLRAFPLVKARVAGARLVLTGKLDSRGEEHLLRLVPAAVRADVEFAGLMDPADLPGLYSRATVTVLPAIWEAYGLVLVESLACGTPVVAANHAGPPDIIGADPVGILFEPGSTSGVATNVEGLAEAIVEAIRLAERPDIAGACRRAAERNNWHALGPMYEQLYREVAGR